MTTGTRPGHCRRPRGWQRGWTSRVRAYFLKHEWLRGYTLLSPALLVMICALALPIFTLVVYSFWTQDYVYIDETLSLKNYATFLRQVDVRQAAAEVDQDVGDGDASVTV